MQRLSRLYRLGRCPPVRHPPSWTGHTGYHLGLADDPFQLQEWIEHATAQGHTARTAAGFCWPWTRTRSRGATTLPLDITIDVPAARPGGAARTWRAAWNAATALTDPGDGRPLAPHSQLWASHTGGHQQIGCIYTAQGVEYHHAGVIIGPDLTWKDGHWHAHPQHSRDEALRHLTPDQYLPYALNTYRVLLTRGTHTTHIHTTDTNTHHLLQQLIPPIRRSPATTVSKSSSESNAQTDTPRRHGDEAPEQSLKPTVPGDDTCSALDPCRAREPQRRQRPARARPSQRPITSQGPDSRPSGLTHCHFTAAGRCPVAPEGNQRRAACEDGDDATKGAPCG
ncbi:DNA/RNA helicase domain-containing protein [Streptomyces sp. PAL114]|uniref:DNA/RNA helicase domain-containing protein n=1 Tax=Streptomyces sp. PAL114 TaxID=2970893 RepID=UPI0028FD9242|nr:DNA/RNA helicase domain-containing protein [Streptomyces sp. PAL114]MDU0299569.1 DNA/RNA helicase domain-containing protein [Streptomyces sp. PAL114]